jgi:hypothetical protein
MAGRLAQVGVRGADGTSARSKQFWEEYEPISQSLAREIQEYENNPRHKRHGSLAQEEFHRLREENTAARSQYRMWNDEDYKSQHMSEARVGRILHMNHFLLLLRSAGLKVRYADKGARPGMLGVWATKNDVEEYICFAQVPLMQEYEDVYFDEYGLPLGPKRRGWRTVLLRLIIKGFITEEQANQVFGTASGPASRRYLAELHNHRNNSI